MAQLVMAACSSHAPMMLAARDAAPESQRVPFFDALAGLRRQLEVLAVTTVVIVSNEHFTNFFLENFPQLCVGVGDQFFGPVESWLGVEQRDRPGNPRLADHIVRALVGGGVDAAFSHALRLDHGIVSVMEQLGGGVDIPLVPIVQNCAVEPMVPLARCVEIGRVLGIAIRNAPTDDRVAVIGAGGLSHWVGHPRVGDIDEEFDRWFLDRLSERELASVLALTDRQLSEAGNGAHEIRSWLTVAAAAGGRGTVLAYEAIHPWITGMGVMEFAIAGGTP